jgi:geranylgeranyl diphosphate synthase type II
MAYSLFAGGKRLRPVLCMAGASVVGADDRAVLPVACALEFIHTYSLIHDDLPAMDDDDLRRGKPTCHKVFGEAMAVLAGDGLLTEAFHLMTDPEITDRVPPRTLIRVIRMIALAAGPAGMVGGQAVDIRSEGERIDLDLLAFMHAHKTGALITASVAAGALLGLGNPFQIRALTEYGKKIGAAFQISDDILDVEGDSLAMGKQTGADERKGKATYPALVGLPRAKEIQSGLVEEAIIALDGFGKEAEPLRHLARYIIERKK